MPRRSENDPFYKPYDPDFHPADLIEIMKQGKFNVHVWTKWDIDQSTFYRWRKEHPELEEAYQKGLAYCEVHWIDNVFQPMIRGELEGRHSFNAAMAMANAKFGYRKNEGESVGSTTNININNMNVLGNKSSEELLEHLQENMKFLKENNIIDSEYKVLANDQQHLPESSGTPEASRTDGSSEGEGKV